jgi:hypothetical protein
LLIHPHVQSPSSLLCGKGPSCHVGRFDDVMLAGVPVGYEIEIKVWFL